MTVLYRIIESLGLLKHHFFLSDRLYHNSYMIQHVFAQFLRQRNKFTSVIYRAHFLIHFNIENTVIAISLASSSSANLKGDSIKFVQEKAELAFNI